MHLPRFFAKLGFSSLETGADQARTYPSLGSYEEPVSQGARCENAIWANLEASCHEVFAQEAKNFGPSNDNPPSMALRAGLGSLYWSIPVSFMDRP